MDKAIVKPLEGRLAIVVKRDGFSPRGKITVVSDDSLLLTNEPVEHLILFSEIVEIGTVKEVPQNDCYCY